MVWHKLAGLVSFDACVSTLIAILTDLVDAALEVAFLSDAFK